MGIFRTIIAYVSTGIVFLAIDFVWLGIMTPRLYKPQLATYMTDKFNLLPAILFYILFTVGLMVLVVFPAVERGSMVRAMLMGGLLGLVAYSTYDLTNLSSIKNWPLIISVVDIAWGTILSATTATVGYLITRALS